MFRSPLVAVMFAGALAGCSASEPGGLSFAEACEHAILEGLISPSTFQRIGADPYAEFPELQTLLVEFDAQNSFGALVRGSAVCTFDGREFDPREGRGVPRLVAFRLNGEESELLLLLAQIAIRIAAIGR